MAAQVGDFALPFLGVLLPIVDLVLIGIVIARKREPSSAFAWSLAIAFLPILGAVLFLLFGLTPVPRRLQRKMEHTEQFGIDFDFPAATHATVVEGSYPDDEYGAIGRMLEGLGEPPRRSGNDLAIYRYGADAFEAMCHEMSQARHHIHLEYFIFRYDELGRRMLAILDERIAAGVKVRVLIDGVGSLTSWKIVDHVRRSGGEARTFLPLLVAGQWTSPNLRSHRKILICDGRIGFFGGLNVGVEYLGGGERRGTLAALSSKPRRTWCDLHARLEGPAVRDLQRLFVETWHFITGHAVEGEHYFPPVPACGNAPVQIIAAGPDRYPNAIREAYFAAFARARQRILLATPYLVPDRGLRDALKSAARSGVAVDVLFQGRPPDRHIVFACGLHFAEELLHAGVRVWGLPSGMMHAKACVVDSRIALLGTANLDNRSLGLNYEQMAVCDGPDEVAAIEAELEFILARSEPYSLAQLRHRPLRARALSQVARLFAPLL